MTNKERKEALEASATAAATKSVISVAKSGLSSDSQLKVSDAVTQVASLCQEMTSSEILVLGTALSHLFVGFDKAVNDGIIRNQG